MSDDMKAASGKVTVTSVQYTMDGLEWCAKLDDPTHRARLLDALENLAGQLGYGLLRRVEIKGAALADVKRGDVAVKRSEILASPERKVARFRKSAAILRMERDRKK